VLTVATADVVEDRAGAVSLMPVLALALALVVPVLGVSASGAFLFGGMAAIAPKPLRVL